MSLRAVTVLEPMAPLSPLVVDSPHSGRTYGADFAFTCPKQLLRQAEDAYMDEVIAGAVDAGGSLVLAEFPRTMVDVNRAESDIDPAIIAGPWQHTLAPSAMTLLGFGLIRRICRSGISLYDRPLTADEIKRRIETYYRPYHAALSAQIDQRMKLFGACYFLDAHSMPDRVENGIQRPDFVLGDRDGTTCDQDFTRMVQRLLQQMGYKVELNQPYKGREIVRRHGREGAGAHALQIEINRRLYLDESLIEKNSGFLRLQKDMTHFFRRVVECVGNELQDRFAAEYRFAAE